MAKLSLPGFVNYGLVTAPPSSPMNEAIEFLTDVVETHDGSEDRTSVRSIARVTLNQQVPTKLPNWQAAFNLADQNIRGAWGVPNWQDAQYVGNVSGTSITIDTQFSKFRVSDAVLFVDVKGVFQVSRVVSVNTTGVVVSPGITAMKNVYVVPIGKGNLIGEVSRRMGGYGSEYSFTYEQNDPAPYPTKIAALFALDVSGSMSTNVTGLSITKLAIAKLQIIPALEALRGAIENSNVSVDLAICFWSTVSNNHVYLSATVADINAAIAIVNAQGTTGGTTPLIPFQFANTFFGTTSPNDGERKDIFFFITDAAENNDAARAEALNMITRVAPYDGAKSVDIYAINIDTASTVQALKVDNASNGLIGNVSAATPDAMQVRFIAAIEAHIGRQWKGREVLITPPVSDGDSAGFVSKIEDRTDFETGRYDIRSPWLHSRNGHSHGFFIDGKEEALAFRRFLYRRYGKKGSFYSPTFQDNFNFTSFASDRLSAFIAADEYDAYNTGRREIAVQFVDTTWQFLTITAVAPSIGGGRKLDFDRAIAKPLSEVAQVCYLIISRFDSDRTEINWIGNRCGETTITITGLE